MKAKVRSNHSISICAYCAIFLAVSLMGPSIAECKEKVNPSDFPETANVLSARVVTADTGVTVRHNPACDDPQGAFMKGFCSQAGTQIVNNHRQYVEVVATLGKNTYTLVGDKLPPPGQYKARFLENGSVDLMGPSPNGELHVHNFKVVAIEVTGGR